MSRLGWTTAVAFATAIIAAAGGVAQAAAPAILNASPATFLESSTITDGAPGNRVTVTLLVRHDLGRTVTGVAIDQNYDGIDNTATIGPVAVNAQYYGLGTNHLQTSVVTLTHLAPPAGFDCNTFGSSTRELTAMIRYRAVVNSGERSNPVSAPLHIVDEANCTPSEDAAHMHSQSQSATDVAPGQQIAYYFQCNDPDTTGANDRCAQYRWRWRRLNDGTTSPVSPHLDVSAENTNVTLVTSFPTRGHYVVEAQLGGEDGQWGDWFRMGNARVNSQASSMTGSLAFGGAVAGSPPSVNAGSPVSATATLSDPDGTPQVIEWDATGDGTFERREFTFGLPTPELSISQRTQWISTATAGLKTVAARFFDNGALDAADVLRRSLTISGQLRVNAIPVASDGSSSVTPQGGSFQLAATDADNQPAALTYDVVTDPAKGDLSCSAGGACTYTPQPGAAGTDTFTFRARDGSEGLGAAWSHSNTATYSIEICTTFGTPGDDVINGTPGNDVICGLGGDDTISGLGGNDTLLGGPGNDTFLGGKGDDTLDGGPGSDIAGYYDSGISGVTVDLVAGSASGGGAGTDTLTNAGGLSTIERISASPGNDTITGDAQPNILDGRQGGDQIDAGDGYDTLIGGIGDDTLLGGAGNDIVQPGAGADAITGGDGGERGFGDHVRYNDATSAIEIDLGSGYTAGGAAGDTIAGVESISGSAFDDVIHARLDGVPSLVNGNKGDDQLHTEDADGYDRIDGGLHSNGDTCTGSATDSLLNCP